MESACKDVEKRSVFRMAFGGTERDHRRALNLERDQIGLLVARSNGPLAFIIAFHGCQVGSTNVQAA